MGANRWSKGVLSTTNHDRENGGQCKMKMRLAVLSATSVCTPCLHWCRGQGQGLRLEVTTLVCCKWDSRCFIELSPVMVQLQFGSLQKATKCSIVLARPAFCHFQVNSWVGTGSEVTKSQDGRIASCRGVLIWLTALHFRFQIITSNFTRG